jgi:integron integrase
MASTAEGLRPRLLDAVRQQVRYMHYSLRTEEAYVHWVRAFIRFHDLRHPSELSHPEVEAFLTWLATDRQVAPGTHRQALSALLFLYQKVLRQDLPWMREIGRPRNDRRLPVVLTVDEVADLLAQLDALQQPPGGLPYGLIGRLLYGTGMRLLEGLRLRVKDVDFERRAVVVREGKGTKDRVVMLPAALEVPLRAQLAAAHTVWAADRAAGLPGVQVPHALARKYQRAAESWAWHWVFPQAQPARDPRGAGVRRHHVLEGNFQRVFRLAVDAAGIHKPATPHTLRHYSESMNMPSCAPETLVAMGVASLPRGVSSAYSCASQLLEEGHQLVIGPESSHPALARFDLVQCRLLDVEVCIEIDLRCLDRLVAEPQRDDAAVGAGLQQLHGCRVAQHVRGHMLVAQTQAALTGPIDMLGQQVVNAVWAEAIAARAGKDDRFVLGSNLAQPSSQDMGRRLGQWRRALLAALAQDANMCPCSQAHGAAAQLGDLRKAQPSLHGQEHERVVPPTGRGAQVRRTQHGVGLLAREKADLRSSAAHAGNGQYPLNLCSVLWHLERRIAEERANGRQTQVAAAGTDAPAALQVLQERGDQRRVDLFEQQALWCNAKPLVREAQQLPKAVAVRGDRMSAALALLHQSAREEGLQQRRKSRRAHERCSQRRSTQAMANAMSCGCALKYQ